MQNYDLDNFEPAAKIVVIGVGGAGNNAVNRMIDEEIENVEFYVANTDKQALATSKSSNRIILGQEITGGLGAGGNPEIGKQAAEASEADIKEIVKGANMVFVAAGMGGGTGTGAAPIVARIAKEAGALVIAIVTRPFTFEGKKRFVNSIEGLNNLKEQVDSIIVVSNDKLLMTAGNAPISEAFNASDKVLAQSVKTVVNLILLPAIINLDFADVKSTLKDSGVALIGFGLGSGPQRAKQAAEDALNSPLLEASMKGAKRAIVAVTCGPEVSLLDAQECVNLLTKATGQAIDVKFGVAINDQLSDEILVSVIASDFEDEIEFTTESTETFRATSILPKEEIKNIIEETPAKAEEEADNKEEETKEEVNDEDILPNFLKDLNL
ncbi:MAG: cell division protein FtsZ [Bacilli bacterium]|nr:cell division protein FtsZ [Bacilli bacterium]